MGEERKYIDLQEFCKLGFLQEINRLFLHPAGLALEVNCDDDEYTNASLTGIWDSRDDPEGIIFAWPEWDHLDTDMVVQKAKNVTAEINRHREARTKLFASMYPQYAMTDTTVEPLLFDVGGSQQG